MDSFEKDNILKNDTDNTEKAVGTDNIGGESGVQDGDGELMSPWAKAFFHSIKKKDGGTDGDAILTQDNSGKGGRLYGGDYDEQGNERSRLPETSEDDGNDTSEVKNEECVSGGVAAASEDDGNSDKSGNTAPRGLKINALTLFLILTGVIIVTVFVTFFLADKFYYGKGVLKDSSAVSFENDLLDRKKVAKFQDIIKFIEENYYTEYDINKLVEGAIEGMVDALEDPYGGYYPPGNMTNYTSFIEGSYTGIGFKSSACDEGMEIKEIFPDTPAEKAGLAVGDKVTHIDGKEVKALSSEELSAILGTEGVEIKLTVIKVSGKTEDISLKIEKIITPSVHYKELENNIKYICISQFIAGTAEDFKAALNKAAAGKCSGIIIDLRNNPGGYEKEASAVADIILPAGTIATSKDRYGNVVKTVTSDKNEIAVPVVLLVNQNSASASELVAGAFRDFKKGELVGVRTYGKALAQINKVYDEDGSGIVLTTSRYYTPSGECIDGVGIEPTVTVEAKEEYRNSDPEDIPFEDDVQLAKAVEIIKDGNKG